METAFKDLNKELEKKRLVYKLRKFDAAEDDDEIEIDPTSQANLNKILSGMDPPVNPGDIITAEEATEEKVADPEDAFFARKCPYVI